MPPDSSHDLRTLRLEVPAWLRAALGAGLGPSHVIAKGLGAVLVLRAQSGREVHLRVGVDRGAPQVDVLGERSAALSAVALAVRRQLARVGPRLAAWSERMSLLGRALAGQEGIVEDAPGAALAGALAATLGFPRHPDAPWLSPQRFAALTSGDAPAEVRAAVIHGALAAGEVDLSLDAWERGAIDAGGGPVSLHVNAMLELLVGRAYRARPAIEVLERGDLEAARTAGLLARLLHDHAAALPGLACVAREAGGAEAWLYLLRAAAEARAREPARKAVAELLRLPEVEPRVLEEAAHWAVTVGLVDEAEAALERARTGGNTSAIVRLAELALWRGDVARVRALLRGASLDAADAPAAARLLGAAEVLEGRHAEALRTLAPALEGATPDLEAHLWCARAKLALGDARGAIPHVLAAGKQHQSPTVRLLMALAMTARHRDAPDPLAFTDVRHELFEVLAHLTSAAEVAAVVHDGHAALELAERALARLGGNLSEWSTALEGGRLVWLGPLVTSRKEAIAVQARLLTEPVERVRAGFAALRERMPDSPHPHTYDLEIDLWCGEYEAARAGFAAVLSAHDTRWAWVGLGAALCMLGRPEEAEATWAAEEKRYPLIDVEATFTYRAECRLRRGDLEGAARDLERALGARPGRLGAWALLALLREAQGDARSAEAARARLSALCPVLCREATRRVRGVPSTNLEGADASACVRAALDLLRGNRASALWTFFVGDEMRVVAPDVDVCAHARSTLLLARPPLARALARHLLGDDGP